MEEIWKDVVGYEGLYKVNQYGDIYSNYTNKKLKYSLSHDGYKQYNLYKNKKAYIMMAHKAVAMAFIPNPDNLPIINHKDENKLNCFVENLEWGTYLYNNTYNNGVKRRIETMLNTLDKKLYVYNMRGELIYNGYNMNEYCRNNNIRNSTLQNSLSFNVKNNYKILRPAKGFIFSNMYLTAEEVRQGLEKYRNTLSFMDIRDDNGCFIKSDNTESYRNMHSKIVNQFDLQRNFLKSYSSTRDVNRQTGFSQTTIARACRLGIISHNSYWEYA